MDENYKRKQQRLIENAYCPTSELTAIACIENSELKYKDVAHAICIEVPFDQYGEVIAILSEQLGAEVVVKDVVKQGAFTYAQVKHTADAGNIHHLHVNVVGRIYFEDEPIGISTAIAFAQSKWNGAERKTAIENGVVTGLTILGDAFAEDVISHELERINASEHIEIDEGIVYAVKQNGAKVVVKKMATKATQKAMYGSVMAKKAILLLNANVVTGALVTGVMSTVDIARAIKGELSPAQLFKNIAKTTASVAGGIAGTIIGGGVGFSIPNVSTTVVSIIGGIIGLLIGSSLASKVTKKVLDLFIKDDSLYMLEIFNTQLAISVEDYLLNEQELKQALHDFNTLHDMPNQLREMYASEDREAFAKNLIESELSRIVKLRMYLHVPTNQEIYKVLQSMQ
ncbi:hypothetical protein [Solibacillus sp. FSL H8-0538]|uniref:hypothetical protein n=1 Tax=Solibacillus sp. FSL H8-0538 TaxID=2921400 RepID=UPI0030F6D77E